MSAALDWITANPWAVAAALASSALLGYAVTRAAALRGATQGDDSSAWIALCLALHPDTRHGTEHTAVTADEVGIYANGGDGD